MTSVHWYTPTDIVERARYVLGGIDLDPCSSPVAQRTVKASSWWSESGLARPWQGRVFCNPPSPAIPWWEHGIASRCPMIFVCYSIEALPRLTGWEQHVLALPEARIRFLEPVHQAKQRALDNGRPTARFDALPPDAVVPGPAPAHASAILGVRVNRARFHEAFAPLGGVSCSV